MATFRHEIKTLAPRKESYDKPRQHIKKQRHHCANKSSYSQSYDFSSSHIWMWELDHKQDFRIVVLEKTLETSLDSKEIKPFNPKGNQPWIFVGRTDAEARLQYFGHLMWRADSLKNTLMLGKTEGRRRRGWQRMRRLDGITDLMDNVFV